MCVKDSATLADCVEAKTIQDVVNVVKKAMKHRIAVLIQLISNVSTVARMTISQEATHAI